MKKSKKAPKLTKTKKLVAITQVESMVGMALGYGLASGLTPTDIRQMLKKCDKLLPEMVKSVKSVQALRANGLTP